MGMSEIWVLVETSGGAMTATSKELLSQAAYYCPKVVAFVPPNSRDVPESPAAYGASRVVSLSSLDGLLYGVTVAEIMAKRIRAGDVPDAVFFGSTSEGRDCAARLSGKIDRPLLANVVNLELEGETFIADHAIFGGTELLRTRFEGAGPQLFVVRAKSFAIERRSGGNEAIIEEVEHGDIGPAGRAKILRSHVESRTGPKLEEAPVVVSGGRGLGQPGNFEMIETLAGLLRGAPGASRAVVDSGWVPYSYQVGQTGKTVKPDVYLAIGISGATQHMVGMKGAKNIIAINKDADAPIFSIADLGVVGDANKIMPQLIQLLRDRS